MPTRPSSNCFMRVAALVAAFAALVALGISAERRIDVAEVARETPRPDDVLLASFPKSGSHWARFLILRLLDENLDALTFAEAERRTIFLSFFARFFVSLSFFASFLKSPGFKGSGVSGFCKF